MAVTTTGRSLKDLHAQFSASIQPKMFGQITAAAEPKP